MIRNSAASANLMSVDGAIYEATWLPELYLEYPKNVQLYLNVKT